VREEIGMAHPSVVMRRRARAAAIVGTSIAFYDFFLYATAIQLVIAPTLARSGDPSSRWLIGATPFVGFAARPWVACSSVTGATASGASPR
jgi:hypothetical protein